MPRASRPITPLDPRAAITTPGGRRSLGALLHKDLDRALAAALALVDEPPRDAKQLAWLLGYVGRAALGPTPLRPLERPLARAEIDARFAWFVEQLDHPEPKVRAAATIPLAACHATAAAAQTALRARKERAQTVEMACALQLAAGVLTRTSPSLFEPEPVQFGQPSYYANVLARHHTNTALAHELELVHYLGERTFGKNVWFDTPQDCLRCVRAMIRERPRADREAAALALLQEDKPARAVEVAFDHREALPRQTRDQQLRAMTFVRPHELSPLQRCILSAPIETCRHVSQINYLCADHRIPHTPPGRASLLGDGAVVALVDALAAATLDGTHPDAPLVPPELRDELHDDDWFVTLFFQRSPAYSFRTATPPSAE